jgi:hypothetical protein
MLLEYYAVEGVQEDGGAGGLAGYVFSKYLHVLIKVILIFRSVYLVYQIFLMLAHLNPLVIGQKYANIFLLLKLFQSLLLSQAKVIINLWPPLIEKLKINLL